MFTEANQPLSNNSLKKRIALLIQYQGTNYCGWQRQPNNLSVQEVLENSINLLEPSSDIKVVAAGRTDSGVHAAGQVVHFDSIGSIPSSQWSSAINGRLPKNIRVRESILRPINWHACYSAKYRRYRYLIYNSRKINLFLSPWTWHKYKYRLDDCLMKIALEKLIGNYDFSAFQRAGSYRANGWTTIQDVEIKRNGDLLQIDIQATGFLYGMVRLLIGQLVAIGEHRLSLQNFENIWRNQLRSHVKEAAPANGLCLIRVGYEQNIFSKSLTEDSFPSFSLNSSDPPSDPP